MGRGTNEHVDIAWNEPMPGAMKFHLDVYTADHQAYQDRANGDPSGPGAAPNKKAPEGASFTNAGRRINVS
jgi:hypothetical protein